MYCQCLDHCRNLPGATVILQSEHILTVRLTINTQSESSPPADPASGDPFEPTSALLPLSSTASTVPSTHSTPTEEQEQLLSHVGSVSGRSILPTPSESDYISQFGISLDEVILRLEMGEAPEDVLSGKEGVEWLVQSK